jgi:hypothetical protein
LWSRRYDATWVNNEVPESVTVDSAGAVYVAGMGGPSPNIGNVSFLKPVTLKYNAAGVPIWVTFAGGNAQVTVDDLAGGLVFTLDSNHMTSARFDDRGFGSNPGGSDGSDGRWFLQRHRIPDRSRLDGSGNQRVSLCD